MKPTILTHDSSFHSDDVFAVATLLILFPDANVVRSRNRDKIAAADYVVDAGMVYNPSLCRFDHHQPEGAGVRPNGIPYAAFGLVWKEFGPKLAGGQQQADIIDVKLVQPLDAHDNGVVIVESKYDNLRDYTMGDFLYSFMPRLHRTEEEIYEIFMKLVSIAKDLILRELDKVKELVKDEAQVLELYNNASDQRLLIMPEELRWRRIIDKIPKALFIIHPRNDGQWSVRAIQDDKFQARTLLPSAWGGKDYEELQRVTGVSDAIFCHKALFMTAAKSKEGALKLAEIALNS